MSGTAAIVLQRRTNSTIYQNEDDIGHALRGQIVAWTYCSSLYPQEVASGDVFTRNARTLGWSTDERAHSAHEEAVSAEVNLMTAEHERKSIN